MKRNDIMLLVGLGVLTAIIAFILSSVVFKVPSNRSTKVPVAGTINSSFPDIKNDPNYNTIFNSNALDPAVPLSTTTPSNSQPFNDTTP